MFGLSLAGCGKQWQVVKPSDQNPMRSNTKFAVMPLDWSAAQVDDEPIAQWLSKQDREMKGEWPGDAESAGSALYAGVESRAPSLELSQAKDPKAAPFTVRPSVVSLQTGGVTRTILTVKAQVLDSQGRVVEEISTTQKVPSGLMTPTIGIRLNLAAHASGDAIASYLLERSRG